MTLIERMRRQGLPTNVRALFANPTPAGLAAVIGSGGEVAVPPNLIPPGCAAITPEMLPLAELSQADIDRIVGTVPGGASNVQDIYPLAPLQEGILFHHLLAAKGDPYLLQTLMAFDTRERFEDFLGALQAAISRHDILRTAVIWEGLPEPMQVVWREARLTVEEVALDSAAGDVGEQLRARFDPRQYRLDVRRAPLMRLFYTHDFARDRWIVGLAHHHLVDDNTSLRFVVEEIQSHLLGRAERLTPPLPFRNFVAQARLGVSQAEHEAYFRAMLGDVTEPTAPFGLLDAQGDGSGVEEARLDLDAALARRLRARARSLGVSAASLFHQAFAQVLARVSGRADVVFGTVLFGRMHGGEGADRALGMFINTLPVRVRLGEESVTDSVRRMHEALTKLLRHEHASLALVQRCSAVQTPTPLFSALLNYRHSPVGAEAPGEASPAWDGVEMLHAEERNNYPFTLSVDDLGDGFQLTAQTQRPVAPDRISAFMRVALERLIDALETAPETAARTIDVLPDAERRQLLVEWNATAADYPKDRLLHELFEEQAGRAPEAVAVVFEGAHLSYAELNARANQLAHCLRERGVGPDVIVGILRRAIAGDARWHFRRLESRRRLSAARSHLSGRPAHLHDRGCAAHSDPNAGGFAPAPARSDRNALSRQGLAVDRRRQPSQSRPARNPRQSRLCHLHIWIDRTTERGGHHAWRDRQPAGVDAGSVRADGCGYGAAKDLLWVRCVGLGILLAASGGGTFGAGAAG